MSQQQKLQYSWLTVLTFTASVFLHGMGSGILVAPIAGGATGLNDLQTLLLSAVMFLVAIGLGVWSSALAFFEWSETEYTARLNGHGKTTSTD